MTTFNKIAIQDYNEGLIIIDKKFDKIYTADFCSTNELYVQQIVRRLLNKSTYLTEHKIVEHLCSTYSFVQRI